MILSSSKHPSLPDSAAENAFLKLDVKKGPIADRQCLVQNCLRSISLRDLAKDGKTIDKVTTSLLDILDEVLHGTYTPPPFINSNLPPAENVFRELLQRKKAGEAHANGVSSLFYAFTCLLDLSVRRQGNQSKQAAFDLFPLYGAEPADFDTVREKDGRGTLAPDCFFDNRVMFLPKASSVLLILFNRNHNYLARRLALSDKSSDETSSFTTLKSEAAILTQDDRIFEMARYMNCMHFRNVVMEDILKPLMGLPSVGPSHNMDLFLNNVNKTAEGVKIFPEATLLYDGSSIMSEEDVNYVEGIFKDVFASSSGQISVPAFNNTLKDSAPTVYEDRRYRNYAGLQREKNGRFLDADLQGILYDATESHAGSAQLGVPSCQRVFQVNEIERARKEGLCSLNEYRKLLRLKPFTSFEEWTSNPDVADAAKNLYKSIDNLELYPGLEGEDIVPGNGAQFGYTKTFGLLVDIVYRIRYSSQGELEQRLRDVEGVYGNWIYDDCKPRPDNGSFGASLPKLLQRTLPRGWAFNNIYALFPFTIPKHTVALLENGKMTMSAYEIIRPQARKVHRLMTKEAIRYVFNDPEVFPTTYDQTLKALTGGYGYLLGFDDENSHDADLKMSLHALLPDANALKRYAQSFSRMTQECVQTTTKLDNDTYEIDVGRNVINAVCTRWVCETLIDFPLQKVDYNGTAKPTDATKSHPLAAFLKSKVEPKWPRAYQKWLYPLLELLDLVPKAGQQQGQADIHAAFAAIYAYVFHNVDPENEWRLREQAFRTSQVLVEHIRKKLPQPSTLSHKPFWRDSLDDIAAFATLILREYVGMKLPGQTAQTFLDRVVNTNKSVPPTHLDNAGTDRVIANVIGLAIVAAVKYAKVCTQAVEFYMQDKYDKEREDIIRLSKLNDDASRNLLMGYIREAYRLNHPLGIWRSVSTKAVRVSIPQGANAPSITAEAGDMIFADFSTAFTTIDPSDPSLVNPLKVDPRRKTQGLQGFGLHKCPGMSFVDWTMPQIFKEIFRLENIQRAPGLKGKLVQFSASPESDTIARSLLDDNGNLVAFPTSLVLRHDRKASAPTKPKWSIPKRTSTDKIRWRANVAMSAIVMALVLWNIFRIVTYVMSFFTRSPPSVITEPPAPSQPPAACPLPKSSIHPWEIVTMKAGEDGKLIPIEYTLDLLTAHTLSIVDIDAKDMVMSFWLDNKLLGSSYSIELNKSDNCGENYGDCLNRGFSGGYLEFPKGKHTVRIEWAGVETPGPDGKIDWGEEAGRRVAWSRDSCAAD